MHSPRRIPFFRSFALALTLPLALVGLGCSGGDPTQAGERTTSDEVVEELGEGWDELKQYALDRRDELHAVLGDELGAMEERIAELQAQAETASAEAGEELRSYLGELELRREELASELEELQDTGGEAWDAARDDLVDSMQSLARAVEDAREELAK